MALSQIGTKILLPALAIALTFNSFALANDRLNSAQDVGEVSTRLQALYANKNRPFPKNLTIDINAIDLKKAAAAATNKGLEQKSSAKSMQRGGVSDGGGVTIQGKLLDFAENEGSLLISIQELLALEPLTEQILTRVNQQIVAVKTVHGKAFGDFLIEAIQHKRIYLENKEISSEGCKNQSMFTTAEMYTTGEAKIAGCQSGSELRISVAALLDEKSSRESIAGLFIHELLLAVTRDFSAFETPSVKQDREERVRVVNRAIFQNESPQEVLKKELGLKTYTRELKEEILFYKKQLPQFMTQFCVNPTSADIQLVAPILKTPYLGQEISKSDLSMLNEISFNQNNKKALKEIQMGRKCENLRLDAIPMREPNYSVLTSECVRHILKAAAEDSDYDPKDVDAGTLRYLRMQGMGATKSLAHMCAGLKGIELQKTLFMTEERGKELMNEAYIEALVYYRWLMFQHGEPIKFTAME